MRICPTPYNLQPVRRAVAHRESSSHACCGKNCSTRRALFLTSDRAKWIECTMNLLLFPLCGFKMGCSILSKIHRVSCVNGTAVQSANAASVVRGPVLPLSEHHPGQED